MHRPACRDTGAASLTFSREGCGESDLAFASGRSMIRLMCTGGGCSRNSPRSLTCLNREAGRPRTESGCAVDRRAAPFGESRLIPDYAGGMEGFGVNASAANAGETKKPSLTTGTLKALTKPQPQKLHQ